MTACLLCIDTTSGLSIHWLTAPTLTAFLLSWPISFLPNRVRQTVQIILGECFIVLCLVDCYCQVFLGTPISTQILNNILLSDSRETSEFLSTFIGTDVIFNWRIILLLVLAVLLPISLFPKRQPPFACNGKKLRYAGILALAFCGICEIPTTYRYIQLYSQKQNLESIEGLIFRHYHKEIPTPLHRIAFALFASEQSVHVLDDIKRATFTASVDSCSHLSPHIVLIIGESYNKHHASLYGYQLPTTPLQQSRQEKGELHVFTDVVTPWNITSNVFLDMFSLWEHDSRLTINNYPLFPILFQRAGYSVTFFSNQYVKKGLHKGATNQAGHFFLADGEMSDSLFSFRNRKASKFDLGLVGHVASYLKDRKPGSYTLDIIHLIGQHFEYAARYPNSQATFSLSDYKERALNEEAKKVVMHYDNATSYNDMVLDSLLSLYEQEETIVLFVADHGEEAYDEQPIQGRLFQTPTATQAKYEFEVPMWIWCSGSYQAKHPEIVSSIRNSTGKPLLSDGLPQTLLFLAGIGCEWTNDSHNILSPHYQSKPRIIGGDTDYDRLMK